jgi:hypothetical protein
MVVEEQNEKLDTVYRSQRFQDSEKPNNAEKVESETAPTGEDNLLLSPGAASEIVALLDLKETAVGDITKALEQAKLRLEKSAADTS